MSQKLKIFIALVTFQVLSQKRSFFQQAPYTLRKSVDPDTEWLIKEGKYYFEYKPFVLADANQEFISRVHVTPEIKGKALHDGRC